MSAKTRLQVIITRMHGSALRCVTSKPFAQCMEYGKFDPL